MVNILLDAGARINVRDSYGFTPLAYAANSGLKQTVDHFIKEGIDINMRIGPGNSTTLIDLVRDSDEKNHTDMIKRLLLLGADPNIRDGYENKSAIDYAIEQNNQELINLLKS